MFWECFDKILFDQHMDHANGRLAVVHFYAQWCSKSKTIASKLEAMSSESEMYPVMFITVDVDECDLMQLEYKISDSSTTIFFKNGEVVERYTEADEDKIRDTIAAHK